MRIGQQAYYCSHRILLLECIPISDQVCCGFYIKLRWGVSVKIYTYKMIYTPIHRNGYTLKLMITEKRIQLTQYSLGRIYRNIQVLNANKD